MDGMDINLNYTHASLVGRFLIRLHRLWHMVFFLKGGCDGYRISCKLQYLIVALLQLQHAVVARYGGDGHVMTCWAV